LLPMCGHDFTTPVSPMYIQFLPIYAYGSFVGGIVDFFFFFFCKSFHILPVWPLHVLQNSQWQIKSPWYRLLTPNPTHAMQLKGKLGIHYEPSHHKPSHSLKYSQLLGPTGPPSSQRSKTGQRPHGASLSTLPKSSGSRRLFRSAL